MVEALVGIIIATTASVSLLIAIGISVKSNNEAGKNSLNKYERQMIKDAGYTDYEINALDQEIRSNNFD